MALRDRFSRMPVEIEALVQRAQQAESAYLQTGDLEALNVAVSAWQQILRDNAFARLEPKLHSAALNDAGLAYLRLYWARGRIGDLNQAIDLGQRAVKLAPPDSPNLPLYLNNLVLRGPARHRPIADR